MAIFGGSEIEHLRTRVAELEQRVDALSRLLEVPLPSEAEDLEQVRELKRQGKAIQAIKVYRDLRPGVGLREAKDAVDGM